MSSGSPRAEAAGAGWEGRSRGTPLGHRIFIFLIKHVGLGAAYALLVPVTSYFVLTAGDAGRAYMHFFRRARPEAGSGRWATLFRAFHSFGQRLIDKVAIAGGLADRFAQHRTGGEHIQALMDAGRGALLISAHIGNWDMAAHLMKRYKGKVSVVMLEAEDARIRKAVEEATEEKRFEVIPLGNDLSHMIRIKAAISEGRLICIHGDRAMAGSRTAKHDFLGAPARFPLGPFAIAATLQVPVCVAFVLRGNDRSYRFHAFPPDPPDRDPKVHLDHFVARLEEVAHEHPEQWSNFFEFWIDEQPVATVR